MHSIHFDPSASLQLTSFKHSSQVQRRAVYDSPFTQHSRAQQPMIGSCIASPTNSRVSALHCRRLFFLKQTPLDIFFVTIPLRPSPLIFPLRVLPQAHLLFRSPWSPRSPIHSNPVQSSPLPNLHPSKTSHHTNTTNPPKPQPTKSKGPR